jgi:hypothetical protein
LPLEVGNSDKWDSGKAFKKRLNHIYSELITRFISRRRLLLLRRRGGVTAAAAAAAAAEKKAGTFFYWGQSI